MLVKAFSSLSKLSSLSPAKNLLLQTQIRNAVSHPNVAAASSSILQYKPLPRVDGFILDNRNDRQVLLDDYRPKKDPAVKIRYELLDERDSEMMVQYATQHFVEENNVVRSLGTKGEDFIEMFQPMVEKWLRSGTSIIFKEDNKLAGVFLGNIHYREEFEELYRGQLFHDNPKFVLKPDYAEDIKNGPFKDPNTNRVYTLLSELEWQTGKFLPKDCMSLGIGELGATHPKYMKLQLASQAVLLCSKLFQEKGVTHEGGYNFAVGSQKIAVAMGHRVLYSIPYDKFLENGKPVFTNMYDGATEASVSFMAMKDKQKLMGKKKA